MAIDRTTLTTLGQLEMAAERLYQEVEEVFVEKEAGKSLITDTEKGQLANLVSTGGTPNIIEEVKVNGAALVPDASKSVNVTVPTKLSDLTNDSSYLIAADIANKADKATTLVGYGITDAYTKTQVDGLVTGVLHYIGTYDTFALLIDEVTSPNIGDVYNIRKAGGTDENGTKIKAGDNVVWSGSGWDAHSGDIDLSAYATTATVDTLLDNKVDKVTGKQLSTEDFTTALSNKLEGIFAGSTKVAASTNGKLLINDVDTLVYELPSTVIHTTNIASDASVTEMLNGVFA